MKIEIWDIDGTITYVYGDIKDTTGLSTYAFWPLITEHFTKDRELLKKMISEWEESMKSEKDPTYSSHVMLQKGIDTFHQNVTQKHVYDFAKKITLKFIKHGVIRKEAVAFLEKRVNQGVTCVLSTGSYQDGAIGFVDALAENGLLSEKTKSLLLISGAVIDWKKGVVVHANVRDRKLIGIENVTGKKIHTLKPFIHAVYADDPWINDRDILSIAPTGRAYVITTVKNAGRELPEGCFYATWSSIIAQKKEIGQSGGIKAAISYRSKL